MKTTVEPTQPLTRSRKICAAAKWLALSATLGAALACSSDGADPGNPDQPDLVEVGDGIFESSPPGGDENGNNAAESADGSTSTVSGTGGSAVANDTATGGDPQTAAPGGDATRADGNTAGVDDDAAERAIEEADIIKLDGDTLYALSQYGGLSVIDIGDPEDLQLLGRHKVLASPFEMYVRDGIAMVLYNGYGEYDYDENEDLYTWYQNSYVVAVDTTSPESIAELGRFPIAGYIADTRIVGDVLYVAAYEDGYCWQCDQGPRTNVMSLDVSNPSDIELVDELSFEERQDTYSWRRSLSATDQRLYIAGPAWGAEEPVGSTIQVIDISDPSGDMQLGDSVTVDGQIQSRWQMDEFEGVLRVISQPFTWRSNGVPSVETFEIASAAELTALGATDLVLPRPETLQSVRFDGTRAYAITFEQTDPLFTIDLSDPADPQQVGELEMPGWVYYMHPLGDRVLGLGFDQGNEEGSITVSIFDVSDLADPQMLDRVNFGGDWGSLAEDQDRIHKAFNVMDDQDLILVPFSGWSYDDTNAECWNGEYLSGVQLVDWNGEEDTLDLRGVAGARGQARRGFIVDDRLFTMSDDRLETFDIDDRDAPDSLDTLSLAERVEQTAGNASALVKLGYDWWTNVTEVTVSSLADAGKPGAGVTLELPQLNQESCNSYSWLNDVRASGDHVYFLYEQYSWDNTADGKDQQSTRVITLDTSDATAPEVAGDAELPFVPSYSYGYVNGLINNGRPLVSIDSTLIFSHHEIEWNAAGTDYTDDRSLKLVDMSDPSNLDVTDVSLPAGQGSTDLLVNGNIIASSHFRQSPVNPSRVRFYLDRVDISDPSAPELLPSVNIPGSLLAYDAESAHAITVDYEEVTENNLTSLVCYEQKGGWWQHPNPNYDYANYNYETTPGDCHFILQTLHLLEIDDEDGATLLDSYALGEGNRVGLTSLGDDRLFVSLGGGGYYYGGVAYADDVAIGGYGYGYGYSSFNSGQAPLLVLGGLRSSELEVGRIELETGDDYYGGLSQLVASGERAVVATGFRGKLSVVDGADAKEPSLLRDVEVSGYVQDLDIIAGVAVASLGYDGVQTIRIDD